MRADTILPAVVVALGLSAGAVLAQSTTSPPPTTAPPASDARAARRAAQGGGRGAAGQGDPAADRVNVVELQRLFDAYVVMQAQEALKLEDAQFAPFLRALKALQDTRRRNEIARIQLVQELARMTAPGQTPDDAALKDKIRALQEADSRAAADLRKAYDALDQVLDVARQARFRVFEQQMERRKFELMLRARRAEAARREPAKRP